MVIELKMENWSEIMLFVDLVWNTMLIAVLKLLKFIWIPDMPMEKVGTKADQPFEWQHCFFYSIIWLSL